MRTMFDSTSPWDIPRDASMVAYYVDGRYAWPQEWLDMFPRATKVSISAIGARTAQVGDVEVGCIWPVENAVDWVLRAREDGYDPTVYVNQQNDWGPCRRAFQRRGVPEPHWWVANYDGRAAVPAGAVAKQYMHPHDADYDRRRPLRSWETGKHYDKSVVADYWPGVDTQEEQEMGYNFSQETLPATNVTDYAEHDVIFPDLGGAMGVTDRWVKVHSPGQPFIDSTQVARREATVRLSHFLNSDGDIVGSYAADETVLEHHQNGGSVQVPASAVKLVLQYNSVVGLLVGLEVKTS